MRLKRLTMRDFRGFAGEVVLELDRPLTVLVGVNGSGKSSVLDCLAVLLSHVEWWDDDSEESFHGSFSRDDIHGDAGTAAMRLEAEHLSSAIDVDHEVANSSNTTRATGFSRAVLDQMARGDSVPLSAYYPTERSVVRRAAPKKMSAGEKIYRTGPHPNRLPPDQRVRAFDDALWLSDRGFDPLLAWMSGEDQTANIRGPVHDVWKKIVPEVTVSALEGTRQRFIFEKAGNILKLNQLSAGEKNILAITGDLARRLAIANPKLDDPLQGEAVVLIDEIELHLHPKWQREILGRLRKTFPNCQFIVTTHSPQVISEVETSAIVLIEDFKFREPGVSTFGRDTNAILTHVMDTPERRIRVLEKLREVGALIDRGDYEAARRLLDVLQQDSNLSRRDGEVVRLNTVLSFMEKPVRASRKKGK